MHMNFAERCVVETGCQPWHTVGSPQVQRQWLEQDNTAAERATSIVKCAPGACLDASGGLLGEEILILDGVLTDACGDYGPGCYIKQTAGASHDLYSKSGCTLFVKQGHLDKADQSRVVIESAQATWRPGLVVGLSVLPLHEFKTQHTALVRWAPQTYFSPHRHYGGEEIFVVNGMFEDEHGQYPAGTWIRSPHLSQHQPFSQEGCLIWVKVGHLP